MGLFETYTIIGKNLTVNCIVNSTKAIYEHLNLQKKKLC